MRYSYIPDEMLNYTQREAQWRAIADAFKKTVLKMKNLFYIYRFTENKKSRRPRYREDKLS